MRRHATCLARRRPLLRAAVWFCKPTNLGGAITNTGSHEPSALKTPTTLFPGRTSRRRAAGAMEKSLEAEPDVRQAAEVVVAGRGSKAGARFSQAVASVAKEARGVHWGCVPARWSTSGLSGGAVGGCHVLRRGKPIRVRLVLFLLFSTVQRALVAGS